MKITNKKIISVFVLICMITSTLLQSVSFALDDYEYKGCWNDSANGSGNGGDEGQDEQFDYCEDGLEPVNFFNGNFEYQRNDLFILAGRGLPLEITRYYNTQETYEGPFGRGWSHNHDIRPIKIIDGTDMKVVRRNKSGSEHVFAMNNTDNNYVTVTKDCYDVFTEYTVWPQELIDIAPAGVTGGYQIKEPHGKIYLFDTEGKLRVISDRNRNTLKFSYDGSGRLIEVSDSLNRKITFEYNSNNKIIRMRDFKARVYAYEYDANQNLISADLPATADYPEGEKTTYSYDENNRLVSITDPEGNTYLINVYDDQNRVVEQRYGDYSAFLSYEPLKTVSTDWNGIVSEYYFNPDGTTQKKIVHPRFLPIGDTKIHTTLYEYNEHKETVKTTYPMGNVKEKEYDDQGNVTKTIRRPYPDSPDAESIIAVMSYESLYNMIASITDAKGKVTTFEYDSKGNLEQMTSPEVDGRIPVASFTYNQFGQIETATDSNGIVTKYEYTAATGYLTKVINNFNVHLPIGSGSVVNVETIFSYDSVGNLTVVTDANANTTTFEYDALNQLMRTVSPAPFNYETKFSYDRNGNLIRLERQKNSEKTQWQKIEYNYDSRDHLVAIRQYEDDVNYLLTSFVYDGNANRTAVIDAEGNCTTYTHDLFNRLAQKVDAENNVTNYDYDDNGNLVSIEDAKANTTLYSYDRFDRLVQVEYPDTSTKAYTYDNNSNMINKRLRSGENIQYAYDALNRLTTKTYPDTTSVTYSYDAASRLIQAVNPQARIDYTYDALNRVAQVTTDNKTAGYQYDSNGNRTRLDYPDGTYISYSYDEMNRLTQIRDEQAVSLASYSYDILSRRTQADLANNTQAVYSYDNINRLVQLANKINGGGDISTCACTYSPAGNRETMTVNGTDVHAYSYNSIYELTGVDYPAASPFTDTTFEFDALGNRETVTEGITVKNYVSNNLNQYSSIEGANLTYDLNGNLLTDGTNTYEYDCENRLTKAITATNIIRYRYDPFGRRIAKDIYNSQEVFIEGEKYLHDGDQILAEYSSGNSLVRKYVYGTGIDEPIQLIAHGSSLIEKYWYHADGLGSITQITDDSGQVVESYEYDAYGNTTIKDAAGSTLQASSVGNPYGFTGRELDNETGLYYYRARYYAPELGRFLQTDPVGYGDSMNLYQYCFNSPNNFVDPLGLFVGISPSLNPQKLPPTAEWLFNKWLESEREQSRERGKCPKKVLIGEDMARILAYMAAYPNERFDAFLWDDIWPFSAWIPTPVLMEFNKKWIEHMMDENREIIDIGRSPRRREDWEPISPYYRMERLETEGYYRKSYDYFPFDFKKKAR